MVLQRSTSATRPDDVLLWGWCEKGDTVTIELAGKGRPIDATVKTVPGQPNLRRWFITYGDVKGGLAPSGPFQIILTSGTRKKPIPQKIENVVVGDVWVFGQDPRRGVPLRPGDAAALAAGTKDRLRFLPARSVNWSNFTHAVPGPWREWDSSPATLTNLANLTCYVGRNLMDTNRDVPVGLIVVPREEILLQRVDAPEDMARFPELKSAWAAAIQAGQQAERDWRPFDEQFRRDILQLKREGRIAPAPPPLRIELPARLHLGSFPSLPFAVRGGIW